MVKKYDPEEFKVKVKSLKLKTIKFIATLITILLILILIVGVFALHTWILMLLWNWLVPMLFGLTKITFLQMAGLSILIGLLFKSQTSYKW